MYSFILIRRVLLGGVDGSLVGVTEGRSLEIVHSVVLVEGNRSLFICSFFCSHVLDCLSLVPAI